MRLASLKVIAGLFWLMMICSPVFAANKAAADKQDPPAPQMELNVCGEGFNPSRPLFQKWPEELIAWIKEQGLWKPSASR